MKRSVPFYKLLESSYRRLTGKTLIPAELPDEEAANWLYDCAEFCVLAHSRDEDPTFVYANMAAQRRFGYDWEEITQLPSRLSAAPQDREERQRFIERVRQDGYCAGYSGTRIMKSGQRFQIQDATLWQLVDEEGTVHGQAVVIAAAIDLEQA